MIDIATHKPLKLSGTKAGEVTLSVSMQQLPLVRALFDANGMDYGTRYWEAGYVLTVKDQPPRTQVEFSYRVDPQFIQQLLDSVS